MDPAAHTLFGATLAATGLRNVSRRATATLLIGANLPDIDAIVSVLGRDTSLLLRRGWTHGVLAMVVLPLTLALAVRWWDKRHPPDDDKDAQPFQMKWIVALSFLSVWSHPTLDWMNTYGVRLLMPFDGTWFYGDSLFIIDPWFWLTTAAGTVLAWSHSKRAVLRWSVLTALATILVLAYPIVPVVTKALWVAAVLGIVALRRTHVRPTVVARTGLVTLLLYITAMYGLGRSAENAFTGDRVVEAQSNPMPGNPFAQRVVVKYADRFEVIQPGGERYAVRRSEPDEIVRAAMAAPDVNGFINWSRFLTWQVDPGDDGGHVVTFRDLRYVEFGQEARTIGQARVWLNRDRQPISPP